MTVRALFLVFGDAIPSIKNQTYFFDTISIPEKITPYSELFLNVLAWLASAIHLKGEINIPSDAHKRSSTFTVKKTTQNHADFMSCM